MSNYQKGNRGKTSRQMRAAKRVWVVQLSGLSLWTEIHVVVVVIWALTCSVMLIICHFNPGMISHLNKHCYGTWYGLTSNVSLGRDYLFAWPMGGKGVWETFHYFCYFIYELAQKAVLVPLGPKMYNLRKNVHNWHIILKVWDILKESWYLSFKKSQWLIQQRAMAPQQLHVV